MSTMMKQARAESALEFSGTGGEPIVVPLTADDAYQLPILIPLLRQRFA